MTTWQDGPVTVHIGDALSVLRELPAESVHCVVTSPPYWGLRDYGTALWEGGKRECDHSGRKNHGHSGDVGGRNTDGNAFRNSSRYVNQGEAMGQVCGKCGAHRMDSQLGLEPTPELYVEHMVEVFREVRRVLRPDGTLWLNMGADVSNVVGPQRVNARPLGQYLFGGTDMTILTEDVEARFWAKVPSSIEAAQPPIQRQLGPRGGAGRIAGSPPSRSLYIPQCFDESGQLAQGQLFVVGTFASTTAIEAAIPVETFVCGDCDRTLSATEASHDIRQEDVPVRTTCLDCERDLWLLADQWPTREVA